MLFSQKTFQPKKWATFITLLLLALLINLGCWQLRRAEQKQVLVDNYAKQAAQAALAFQDLPLENISALRYQRVSVEGFYDNAHSILLDNQVYQGKAGYYVLTPLKLSNSSLSVLINRGWLPQGADRAQLPVLSAIPARQTLQGMVYIPLQQSFLLDASKNQEAGWPKRVQALDITALSKEIGYTLQPLEIRLDAKQANGFIRDWQPKYLQPTKHIGYAVQWFALAAALLVIYIVVNIQPKKPE